MVELHEKWCQLLKEYEDIWTTRASMADADVQEKLKKAERNGSRAFKKAAKLPSDDDALGTRTYNDVLRERHLSAPQHGVRA